MLRPVRPIRARSRAFALALALVLASAADPARAATILRVPEDHATITAALAAAGAGDVVEVGAGTFAPSTNGESFPLVVPDGVVLQGAGRQVSVLDAERTGSVVLVPGGTPVIRDFTLTGGDANRGGGVQIEAGSPEIAYNLITGNRALNRGSGINIQGDAMPWIHHNLIWANSDRDLGHVGDPHGVQCGISSGGVIEHNLVGRTDSNGLLTQESASPIIRHNIFYENGIEGLRGRGICNFGAPTTVIAHNLFHGNVISALVMNNAQGVTVNVSAAVADAEFAGDGLYGNVDGDPLFVDVDLLDFALQAGSPAIDAGDPSLPGDPDGSVADIGPFPRLATTAVPGRGRSGLVLRGNAPNPFNPATEIRFSLERSARVRVTVFDLRGRLVRGLFEGGLDAGAHDLRWDGTDEVGRPTASGIYLVQVRTDDAERSHRMTLVR